MQFLFALLGITLIAAKLLLQSTDDLIELDLLTMSLIFDDVVLSVCVITVLFNYPDLLLDLINNLVHMLFDAAVIFRPSLEPILDELQNV